MLAGVYTSTAGDTFSFIVSNGKPLFLRFWVVTPLTAERTPLDENRSTYSGAVVNAKALYIKNVS
jgi:hypothetical protein